MQTSEEARAWYAQLEGSELLITKVVHSHHRHWPLQRAEECDHHGHHHHHHHHPHHHHQHYSKCLRLSPWSITTALLMTLLISLATTTTIAGSRQHPTMTSMKNEQDSSPSFAAPIANVTSVLGRSATLECVVDNLGPYNKVAWLKMDSANKEGTVLTIGAQALFNENKYRVTSNGQRQWYLHIKHVRPSDRGYYMCQVNAKNMTSQTGFLDVQIPPIMLEDRTSTDTTVDEHQKAVLRCGAKGYPRPKITWRREDGKSLNLGLFGGKQYSAQTFEGDQLNLTQVTREDMGAYLCIASNGVPPSLSKRILLHVNFRPKIRVQNQLIDARLGESVELVCIAESYPRPLVTWITPSGLSIVSAASPVAFVAGTAAHNNNTAHTPAGNMTTTATNKYVAEEEHHGYKTTMRLKINAIAHEDFGGFKCLTKNTMGEKEGLIRLYESQSPQFKTAVSRHKSQQSKASQAHGKQHGKANSLKSRKSIRRNKTSSAGEEMLDEEAEDEDEEGPNTDMAWSGATGTHANTQGIILLMLCVVLALSINAAVEYFNLY